MITKLLKEEAGCFYVLITHSWFEYGFSLKYYYIVCQCHP